jgi:hypothetical protein
MPQGDVYTILNRAVTVSTAITVIQIKAGANNGLEIVRASVTQRGSTVSAQEDIAFVRKTNPCTVTAAIDATDNTATILKRDPNQSAASATLSTTATGITSTSEGNPDGNIILREAFNVLNGWMYLPVPEERIYVPPAGILALKFITAPASQTWDIEVVIREL